MKFVDLLTNKNSDVCNNKQVTAAFLGDSVTQGCFEAYENCLGTIYDYENVYHSKLKKIINEFYPAVPLNIINAGISGGNASDGLERLERDVITYCPDLVVVCLGLNDVHRGKENISSYTGSLRSIFKRLKHEKIETIFLTPNMMNTNVSQHITNSYHKELAENFSKVQNSGVMDFYMNQAMEVCDEEEIPICDCYSKWKRLYTCGVNVTELLSNYLNHPTRSMHMLFATELLKTIFYL